jgi:hypothetical protein
VVECLLCKHKALSLNPGIGKKEFPGYLHDHAMELGITIKTEEKLWAWWCTTVSLAFWSLKWEDHTFKAS